MWVEADVETRVVAQTRWNADAVVEKPRSLAAELWSAEEFLVACGVGFAKQLSTSACDLP
jgi:hypothetical protein